MAIVLSTKAQVVKVSSAGNVGIGTGTTTPSQKLHVVGNTFLNGNVGIGGTPSSTYKFKVNGVTHFRVGIVVATVPTETGLIIGDYRPHSAMIDSYPAIYPLNTNMYVGTPNAYVYRVYATGIYGTVLGTSDSRVKKDIQPCNSMLAKIKDVKSYTYDYADTYLDKFTSMQKQEMQRTQYGFLAQEMQKIFPEFVYEDEDSMLSISYISMIPVLTSAINELQDEVETRNTTIDELLQKIEFLETIVNTCCSSSKAQKRTQEFDLSDVTDTDTDTEEMKIYQNAPNPFNETTIINCYIPENIKKAELCIYDMSGSRLKCLTITERGMTNIQIQAGQLAAGVYTYLLIGDGKNSEAKQMILTK